MGLLAPNLLDPPRELPIKVHLIEAAEVIALGLSDDVAHLDFRVGRHTLN